MPKENIHHLKTYSFANWPPSYYIPWDPVDRIRLLNKHRRPTSGRMESKLAYWGKGNSYLLSKPISRMSLYYLPKQVQNRMDYSERNYFGEQYYQIGPRASASPEILTGKCF
jgi:hypothetical protein